MNRSFAGELKNIGFTIIFWIVAFLLYFLFRKVGLEVEVGININDPLTTANSISLSIFVGVITGVIYYFLELLFDKPVIQRESLGFQITIKTLSYLFLINLLIRITLSIQNNITETSLNYTLMEIWGSPALWPFIIYFLLWSLLFSFIKLVNQKFGKGVLLKMLLGKYKKPRIESKIFLFIDLKSSTELAEKLGYLSYSQLIQKCFYDLNEVVMKYKGEIYQYVGDEAVICWDYDQGIKDNTCVECFLSLVDILNQKREEYLQSFGIVPEFKAGLHGGELVVTEVGIIKKEIAYHGDVINTTARIQEKCNEVGSSFLISREVYEALTFRSQLYMDFKGEIPLKGKSNPIGIYSLSA